MRQHPRPSTHTSSPHRSPARLTVPRRAFLKTCAAAAAALGLPASAAAEFAALVERPSKPRPSVIWLHLQECTGCTETLLRATAPTVTELILDLVSLDYHETLAAAAGHQAEAALEAAMKSHEGEYLCVVEGAIPTADGGVYCKIGGRTAVDLLTTVGAKAGAIIALGSCASFGGIAAAPPNPTGAVGAPTILQGKAVVTLPGCPPNPYNLLGTVLHYLTFGKLPALDAKGRPKFAYGRTIHDDCPRRAHFDAGRFVEQYGDEAHKAGHCLYKLGCKGPATHANCATRNFGDLPGVWPVGVGHPCVGCTEEALAFRAPMHSTAKIAHATPPTTYPPITVEGAAESSDLAYALAGVSVGVAAGGALAYGSRLAKERDARRASEAAAAARDAAEGEEDAP